DFLIHKIDECCWMKNDWPVEAKGLGGRHYRGDYVDQNFDTYSVEYTFADGSKFYLEGRGMVGAYGEFASYAHGTKGSAVISTAAHSPCRCRIHKGRDQTNTKDVTWPFPPPEPNPHHLEWSHLIQATPPHNPHNQPA